MSTNKSALSFLNSDCYQIYNREVARMLESVEASIILSDLINRFELHKKEKELVSHAQYGDDLFYYTIEKAEERTCLSRAQQDRAIAILIAWGFIKKFTFGSPQKRYFQLQEDKILEMFGFKKINTELSKTDKSNCEDGGSSKSNCRKSTNRIVENRQIGLYTKELLSKSSTTTPTPSYVEPPEVDKEKVVVVVKSQADSIAKGLKEKADYWGSQWNIAKHFLETLLEKHSFHYVIAQIDYMVEKQIQAVRDEKTSKKRKQERVDHPRAFLAKACSVNFADFREV
jgi:hypothetical protein